MRQALCQSTFMASEPLHSNPLPITEPSQIVPSLVPKLALQSVMIAQNVSFENHGLGSISGQDGTNFTHVIMVINLLDTRDESTKSLRHVWDQPKAKLAVADIVTWRELLSTYDDEAIRQQSQHTESC
jgi:hypothetical protein